MTGSEREALTDDEARMVAAYADGTLPPEQTLEFEWRMAGDARLERALEGYEGMAGLLRNAVSRERARRRRVAVIAAVALAGLAIALHSLHRPEPTSVPTTAPLTIATASTRISNLTGGALAALEDGDRFGHSQASLGDLDGDGTIELAVGTRGKLFLLSLDSTLSVVAQRRLLPPIEQDWEAFSLASLGDIDGDGLPELAMGDPWQDGNMGAVWTLTLGDDLMVVSATRLNTATLGLQPGDEFGCALAALPDQDTEGRTILAIGAQHSDVGGTARGCVYLVRCDVDGRIRSFERIGPFQHATSPRPDESPAFGHAVAALGDVNFDGTCDLAIGAPNTFGNGLIRGMVWIVLLGKDGIPIRRVAIDESLPALAGRLSDYDTFGSALAPLGDALGPGTLGLAVGAPSDDDGGLHRGAVWLLSLTRDGDIDRVGKLSQPTIDATLSDSDAFGSSIAVLGDLEGDGIAKITVGAIGDDSGGDLRGALWPLSLFENWAAPTAEPVTSAPDID